MDYRKPKSPRDDTDKSLRTERAGTDAAIFEQRRRIEDDVDGEIERVRDAADLRQDRARAKADLRDRGPSPLVIEERAREDQILGEQREVSDEQLRQERYSKARSLATLLPLERRKTDRDLLTERNRSDLQLAHRDDFLGMVSHDLRSLLSGLLMEASCLSEEASDSEEGRRTVEAVTRLELYIARMNRLIGDLVDIVGLNAGKFTLELGRHDAAVLLIETAEAFSKVAIENGVELDLEMTQAPLLWSFDHDRIHQVVANLLANAMKFTNRGGRVLIRGERLDAELHVCVSDTGTGIPASMLEEVFERYTQVSGLQTGGLGLGLHISKGIIEAHGGKIWVVSEEGAGSAFHFTIPGAAPS